MTARSAADIATEVTFEDGRKGMLAARVAIRDMTDLSGARASRWSRPREGADRHEIAAGEAILAVENVSLAFGGVKAITDVSFDIRKGEIRAIIGPNGAGKTSMLNVINGFYSRSRAASRSRARRAPRCARTRRRAAASRARSRTSRCSAA